MTESTTSSTLAADSRSQRLTGVVGENLQRVPTGSIQVRPGESGWLIVRLPYTRARVAKIKTVVGRRWHPQEKYWTVPGIDGAIAHLLALFADEPIEVDPSLRSEEIPDHRKPRSEPMAPTLTLLDRARLAIRTRHYSDRMEKAYVGWMRRFISFHHNRHPAEMGEAEVAGFLSSLACHDHVAASTQNQALNAILFLYREVLSQKIDYVNGVVRAKRPRRLHVVLTREEVKRILAHITGREWITAMLLYGTGLRLMECLRLRVKDIDFSRNELVVRSGKEAPSPRICDPESDERSGLQGWNLKTGKLSFPATFLCHALA